MFPVSLQMSEKKANIALLKIVLFNSMKTKMMKTLIWILFTAFSVHVYAYDGASPGRDMKIVCDKIEREGIVSAYETYTFEIENRLESVDRIQWSYSLPLKDGGMEMVSTTGEPVFTIPAVGDESRYEMDADYVIKGIVSLKCEVDGVEEEYFVEIDVDLKPKIISYSEIEKTVNETETKYSIDFTVRYVGSDCLRVGLREEYSPFLEMSTVKEPYLAHVHKSGINTFDRAWVVLIAQNEYGEDEIGIELEAMGDVSGLNYTRLEDLSGELAGVRSIKVFDWSGRYVMQVQDANDLDKLIPGIYVLQLLNSKGACCKVLKYLKR